jgi:glycerophosphoryl diester phosphodiesterase
VSLNALLLAAPFAHRGLWRTGGPPENSLAAFQAACEAGYGVELDVRLTADGEAMVFHDETLERMTAQSGLAEERTADDLAALRLLGSDQTIPTLAQVLERIGGRVPLLVELKTPPGQEGALERRVAALLARYPGPRAAISFNAEALGEMARVAPDTPRGLNIHAGLEGLPLAEPAFLSFAADLARNPSVQGWRAGGGLAICWTVRSAAQRASLAGLADNIIFEGFLA